MIGAGRDGDELPESTHGPFRACCKHRGPCQISKIAKGSYVVWESDHFRPEVVLDDERVAKPAERWFMLVDSDQAIVDEGADVLGGMDEVDDVSFSAPISVTSWIVIIKMSVKR